MRIFRDRRDAGRKLAEKLAAYRDRTDVSILALPRGGVPVAYEVALALNAPLDIFIVRKLGMPGHEEFAIGAIASGGIRVLNEAIIDELNISQQVIESIAKRELDELERRERAYRGNHPALETHNRVAIVIDDGLATGASMRAAVAGLRAQNPRRVVVAVPAAAPEAYEEFQPLVDEIVSVITPEPFHGVGRWYEDFSQTSDEEVQTLLEQTARHLQYE